MDINKFHVSNEVPDFVPEEYQNYLLGFMSIFERHGGELLATSKNKKPVTQL